MLTNRKATSILYDVGVDVVYLVDVADTIFASDMGEDEDHDAEHHEKQLSFDDFVRVVLDLRGTKTSRVKDVVNLRKHINGHFARLEQRLCEGGLPQKSSFEHDASSDKCAPPNSAKHQTVSFVSTAAIQPVAAHEREISFLRTENLQLKEQLANLEDHISSRHSDERVQAPPTNGTFSDNSKSEMVQRCLKRAMSGSNLSSDPLRGSAQPVLADGFSPRADSIEQRFPGRLLHAGHFGAASAVSNQVANSSMAQPRHSQNWRP